MQCMQISCAGVYIIILERKRTHVISHVHTSLVLLYEPAVYNTRTARYSRELIIEQVTQR